jgi:hypothetical protein
MRDNHGPGHAQRASRRASNGTHRIKIVCLGTRRHLRSDLDAFVRLTIS